MLFCVAAPNTRLEREQVSKRYTGRQAGFQLNYWKNRRTPIETLEEKKDFN